MTAGMEVAQQFNWEAPDWISIPANNLGSVCTLCNGLRMLWEVGLTGRLPRTACAQEAHANPLQLSCPTGLEEYRPVPATKTLATAIQIGAPVS